MRPHPHLLIIPYARSLPSSLPSPALRCTPNSPAEDTGIAQASSADATGARHLGKPVVPHPTRRAWPLAGQDHVSIEKDFYCT